MPRKTLKLENPLGMHARLAFSLSALCGGFENKILVGNGAEWADGKEMAGVLALGIGPFDDVTLDVEGENASPVLDKLTDFLQTEGKTL
jgi:phosphotransferase system HPr (HPr) family protein